MLEVHRDAGIDARLSVSKPSAAGARAAPGDRQARQRQDEDERADGGAGRHGRSR
jgi:hypothetical protein